MMIDKISGINPLNNLQNVERSNVAGSLKAGADEINVSDEAKELAEFYRKDDYFKSVTITEYQYK